MAKPRVHEIASEMGVDSRVALRKLRDLGEFVKSPSSTIQPPVARKLRAALAAQHDAPIEPDTESPHPDAVAARIRRGIVRRDDTDWPAYGFSLQEKSVWIRAGVPETKAHIAAMCRDSERRGTNPTQLTPATLSRKLGSERSAPSVLDALLDGSNYLRVQERLASRLGVDLAGVNPDLLRLATSAKLHPERETRALSATFRALPWQPDTSVRIADAALEIVQSVVPAARAHWTLRAQIATYRRDGTISPLLAAYARVHGVMHAGPTLSRLCDGVVGAAEEYAAGLAAADLIERAVGARRFYFLRDDAANALSQATPGHDVDHALPPSPEGVALIDARREDDEHHRSLVFWSTGSDGRTQCILVGVARLANLKPSGLLSLGAAVEEWEPAGAVGRGEASSFLDRFSVRRSRPLGRQHSRTGPQSTSASAEPTGNPELRDIIIAYYSRDPLPEGDATNGPRRSPNHRWLVRGHWRRQWYPGDQVHRVIWIDEHEAGSTDHPLLLAERVEVH